jgi:hypothetical protein
MVPFAPEPGCSTGLPGHRANANAAMKEMRKWIYLSKRAGLRLGTLARRIWWHLLKGSSGIVQQRSSANGGICERRSPATVSRYGGICSNGRTSDQSNVCAKRRISAYPTI